MTFLRSILGAALMLGVAGGASADEPSAKPDRSTGVPANNWADLKASLRACWRPPAGTDGSFVTFRFSLTKEGALRGTPLTTGKHLTGAEAARRAFLESGERIFDACLPIAVTPSFGRQFGFRTLRLTLVNGPPRPARNLNNAMTIFAQE